MKQNKFIWIIGILFIGLIIGHVVQSFRIHSLKDELGITKSDLQRKDKQIGYSIDSIHSLRLKAIEQDSIWSAIVVKQRDSLRIARTNTIKWRIQYEKVKNTPTPYWTDRDLDSLISTITR